MTSMHPQMPQLHAETALADSTLTAADNTTLASTTEPDDRDALSRQIKMLTEFLSMARAFARKDRDAFDEHLEAAVEQMPEMEQALRMTATAALRLQMDRADQGNDDRTSTGDSR